MLQKIVSGYGTWLYFKHRAAMNVFKTLFIIELYIVWIRWSFHQIEINSIWKNILSLKNHADLLTIYFDQFTTVIYNLNCYTPLIAMEQSLSEI